MDRLHTAFSASLLFRPIFSLFLARERPRVESCTHGHLSSFAAPKGKGTRPTKHYHRILYTCHVLLFHFISLSTPRPFSGGRWNPWSREERTTKGGQGKMAGNNNYHFYRFFWNRKEGRMHGLAFCFHLSRLCRRCDCFFSTFSTFIISSVLGSPLLLLLFLSLCILFLIEKGDEGAKEAERGRGDGWT